MEATLPPIYAPSLRLGRAVVEGLAMVSEEAMAVTAPILAMGVPDRAERTPDIETALLSLSARCPRVLVDVSTILDGSPYAGVQAVQHMLEARGTVASRSVPLVRVDQSDDLLLRLVDVLPRGGPVGLRVPRSSSTRPEGGARVVEVATLLGVSYGDVHLVLDAPAVEPLATPAVASKLVSTYAAGPRSVTVVADEPSPPDIAGAARRTGVALLRALDGIGTPWAVVYGDRGPLDGDRLRYTVGGGWVVAGPGAGAGEARAAFTANDRYLGPGFSRADAVLGLDSPLPPIKVRAALIAHHVEFVAREVVTRRDDDR